MSQSTANGGKSAMIWAAESGYTEIVRLLVEKKADLDAKDIIGKELGEMRKGLRERMDLAIRDKI